MSGIVGVYNHATPVNVIPLLQSLKHRGPDGHRVIQTAVGALGHTHLELLDAPSRQQPLEYEQHWLGFNGALYNLPELRQRHLGEQPFPGQSAVEVLLHLYTRFGPSCVALLDGMFAIAVLNDRELFLARDPLGIKPLYVGEKDSQLYFASEIKALTAVANTIREFPAGHWYHSRLGWHKYYRPAFPSPTDDQQFQTEAEALPLIRATLRAAVHKRLQPPLPLGVSLSGGLASSIVALLAGERVTALASFAVGMEGSADLAAARAVAQFLGTKYYECVYTAHQVEAALPDIIYHLESFDPTLVRNAVPNFFLAQLASQHVKMLLTGEGAAELYAGYSYLHTCSGPEELQAELIHITAALHNTNLQRADRMYMAHGLEARLPFLDQHAVDLALRLPPAWKVHRREQPEKALLRRAFVDQLPPAVINRPAATFAQGAGSAQLFVERAESSITDQEFNSESQRLWVEWHYRLPNKEALYYYKILRLFYQDEWILPWMGRSRSL